MRFPAPSQDQTQDRASFGARTSELESSLTAKVFGLLAFCFAFAGAGGVVGYRIDVGQYILPLFIAQIALTFGLQFVRNKEGINLLFLYGATFVSGIIIGAIVESYVAAGAGTAVLQAAGVTGIMTIGLSAYALTTKRNLMALQPFLFIALLGLLAASIVNIFTGGTVMYTIISWAGAMLFSVMLVFDVNRTRYVPDTMGNAVMIALGIYLDIINLFLFVLRIIQGGGRR